MKKVLFKAKVAILVLLLISSITNPSTAEAEQKTAYTLSEAIRYALANNPDIARAIREKEIGDIGIDSAVSQKMPNIQFSSGITRYYYPTAVTPISGSPFEGVPFPEFEKTIYDLGLSFTLPLYRGGRLDRAIVIAGKSKDAAEQNLRLTQQELIYNVTSTYFKILQLQKMLRSEEETVKQFEAHKRDVELRLDAGTVPKIDLLKIEAELSHSRQKVLLVKNGLDNSDDLLRTMMGIDDPKAPVSVIEERQEIQVNSDLDRNIEKALSLRPDYLALLKKLEISEQRVRLEEGKRLPSVSFLGEYTERSGADPDFRENWYLALKLSLPLFDGGLIRSEVRRAKKEIEKVKEEERSFRHRLILEIKESLRGFESAAERISVTESAIESSKENLRIELLKYETGTGTSTDVIDARAALLRAEADYYQAFYDRNLAAALLRKAVGEDLFTGGSDE
jgi:outer membrane protein